MSHHIVHIMSHGARIAVERKQLVCINTEQVAKRIAVADLRAIIIAARGVSFSGEALAAVLDSDAVILHSNARYKPCGLSVPLARVANHSAFLGQIRPRAGLNERLWREILRGKIANQASCLRLLGSPSAYLENSAQGRHLHEGNCARHYWRKFFGSLGWSGLRRRAKESEHNPNHLLNYGYAVLSALCHRSLLVHGLQPSLGLHHRSRYRAIPLVHDFIEPFRPFVDWLMAIHIRRTGVDMATWAQGIGQALRDHRIRHHGSSIKLMDAVDKAASSLSRAYAKGDASSLWIPSLDR